MSVGHPPLKTAHVNFIPIQPPTADACAAIGLQDLPEEVREGAASSGASRTLSAPQLAEGATIPDDGLNFDAVVTSVERDLLLRSLHKTGGNKMRAAKLLNMKRTTFVEQLKRLQIETEGETTPEPADEEDA